MAELVESWGVEDVCAWLRSLKLDDLCPIFEEHDVDGHFLAFMDDDTLVEMGVDSKLKRVKILSKKRGLIGEAQPQAGADRPGSTSSTQHHERPQGNDENGSFGGMEGERPRTGSVGSGGPQQPTSPGRRSSSRRGMVRSMASMRKQREYRKGFGSLHEGDIAVLPGTQQAPVQQLVATDADSDYMVVKGTMTLADRRPADWSSGPRTHANTDDYDDDDDHDAGDEGGVYGGEGEEEDMYGEVGLDVTADSMAVATSTRVDAYMSTRKQLLSMFPGASPQDVEDALRHSKAQWEDAVDHLLALGCTRHSTASNDVNDVVESATRAVEDENPHRIASDSDADWLHGQLTRDQADNLLDLYGGKNGLFLVRESSSIEGAYVLSLAYDGKKLHHIIYADPPDLYQIFDFSCRSLTDLVGLLSDYQRQDGWYTPLTQHVPRSASSPGVTQTGDYATIEDTIGQMRALNVSAPQHHMSSSSSSSWQRQQYREQQQQQRQSALSALNSPQSALTRTQSVHVPPHRPVKNSFDNPFFNADNPDAPPPLPARTPAALALRPQDFDLDLSKPSKPYGGDKTFKVTVTNDDNPLKLVEHGFPRDIVLCTLLSGIQLAASEHGIEHARIAYADVQSVDYADRTLRLVVSHGRFHGTFFFATKKAKTIYRTILENKDHYILEEDKRLAKLLQSEEFMQHLSHDPEYYKLAHATPTKKKRVLSRLASSFKSKMARSIKRRSHLGGSQRSSEPNLYRSNSHGNATSYTPPHPATVGATTSSSSSSSTPSTAAAAAQRARSVRSPLSRMATVSEPNPTAASFDANAGHHHQHQHQQRPVSDAAMANSPLPPLPPEARADGGDDDDDVTPVYTTVHASDSDATYDDSPRQRRRNDPPPFEDPNFEHLSPIGGALGSSTSADDIDLGMGSMAGEGVVNPLLVRGADAGARQSLGPYDHAVDPSVALQDDMWQQRHVDSILPDDQEDAGPQAFSDVDDDYGDGDNYGAEDGATSLEALHTGDDDMGFSDTSFDTSRT
ncbi:hypothetical protein PTSG_03496 [Salpingoeca rosetta]|uniref:SH2 domain-containing protein n=1 Tax=Salpingoeca rosetta (strain ATCC 50818 / BSB-021) TaxID=946362 RepID=F2U5S3_SALR5|nr:uncharacterized protein PTSG_03496 [Salpingoeca rosetta]EGD82864.1 hypothetical protein PTSG_03496 [Salpingoeca rosetta]|eukprot:XP_004995228.1 hypothetical protein PTSG_03496 [Salpingoeca rosetta]